MAANSTNATKMARFLAIMQIITRVLLIGFGIADRLVKGRGYYYYYNWTGYVYFGIWIGIWMCITGGLGIPGSARERTSYRDAFAGVFMGFSITSAVLGGVIIICYSIAISELRRYHSYDDYDYYNYHYYGRYYYNYRGKMAILAIMLVLGIVTFGAGIWAAICTCLMKPCGCCGRPQVDQQMYGYPAGGYFMTQTSAGGVTMAVPMQAMQAGAGGAAAQDYHQPMVLVPVSGAAGGQQLIAQATSPGGIITGTLQQQQLETGMPHSFVDGGYAPKACNGQMQVAV